MHAHTYTYERTHTKLTHVSIFEDWSDKSSRLTKSHKVLCCWRERRVPLKNTTSLNSRKFTPMGSWIQDQGGTEALVTRLVTKVKCHSLLTEVAQHKLAGPDFVYISTHYKYYTLLSNSSWCKMDPQLAFVLIIYMYYVHA